MSKMQKNCWPKSNNLNNKSNPFHHSFRHRKKTLRLLIEISISVSKWRCDCVISIASATQALTLYRVRAEGACSLCRAKTTSRSNTIKHSSNYNQSLLRRHLFDRYSIVFHSFSLSEREKWGKHIGKRYDKERRNIVSGRLTEERWEQLCDTFGTMTKDGER